MAEEAPKLPSWAAYILLGVAVGGGGGGLIGTLASGNVPPHIEINMPESTREFHEAVTTDMRQVRNKVENIDLTLASIYTKLGDMEKHQQISDEERKALRVRIDDLQKLMMGGG